MATVRVYPARQVHKIVATRPVVREAVTDAAERIGRSARRRLAQHRSEGHSRIEVNHTAPRPHGALDAEVVLVDRNALSIEFGHHTKSGKFVPGLNIIRGAAAEHTNN